MLTWRLCREPFADLNGEGARLYGGGWNSPGRPLVYTASTAALAILEVRVNLDLPLDLLPDDSVLVTVDLADLVFEEITVLPPDRLAAGDSWLAAGRTPVLRVPSIIVPECPNLLLNLAHPDAARAKITGKRSFRFDERLWKNRFEPL